MIALSLTLITGFVSSVIVIEDAFAPPRPYYKPPHMDMMRPPVAKDPVAKDPIESSEPATELQVP